LIFVWLPINQTTGMEATFSMGDDAPLAMLSARPHVPYDYLRQRFAQV